MERTRLVGRRVAIVLFSGYKEEELKIESTHKEKREKCLRLCYDSLLIKGKGKTAHVQSTSVKDCSMKKKK